jgi:hypothetical protein
MPTFVFSGAGPLELSLTFWNTYAPSPAIVSAHMQSFHQELFLSSLGSYSNQVAWFYTIEQDSDGTNVQLLAMTGTKLCVDIIHPNGSMSCSTTNRSHSA